jgi:hypothetical protein
MFPDIFHLPAEILRGNKKTPFPVADIMIHQDRNGITGSYAEKIKSGGCYNQKQK